ncbi:MAG: hypothetical protein ACYDA8_19600 [Deferrisomatales bacterium]
MTTDAERALWALEEAVEGVLSFVRGAAYGLRLASKRVGDLTISGAAAAGTRPHTADELQRLVASLQQGEDRLSDLTVLALGDHFRAFLARALQFPQLPALPPDPDGVELLAGTPGALARVPAWFPLLLQLYRVTLKGGRLDRAALQGLGRDPLELPYAGGKMKMFTEGDHVVLSEQMLEEVGRAVLEAAKGIRLRLQTA